MARSYTVFTFIMLGIATWILTSESTLLTAIEELWCGHAARQCDPALLLLLLLAAVRLCPPPCCAALGSARDRGD